MLWTRSRPVVTVIGILALSALAAHGQTVTRDCAVDAGKPYEVRFTEFTEEDRPKGGNCFGFRCYRPEQPSAPFRRLADPACDPLVTTCTVEIVVPLEFPGNEQTLASSSGLISPWVLWFESEDPPEGCQPWVAPCDETAFCGTAGLGGQILSDVIETFLSIGASCQDLENELFRVYSLEAFSCPVSSACPKSQEVSGLDLRPAALAGFLGCPVERTDDCDDCNACRRVGPGRASVGGGGATAGPFGGGAHLWYAGNGGAGEPGLPGSADWNIALGRFWSHTYAQRLVEESDGTVWLITDRATFREFANPDPTTGAYRTLKPSDESRTLSQTASGWELHDVDGTVMAFDPDGRWTSTTDRNDNLTEATYVGTQLGTVTFPDGRWEEFAYHADGKLASITEFGVGGSPSRTWSLTWDGDDLTHVLRPDGTTWVMGYSSDPDLAGSLTRLGLRPVGGTGSTDRVAAAWEYDAGGNVVKVWRGAESYDDPLAVDRWAFAFDDPVSPAETVVTDPLGDESTYVLDRDPASEKPRVREISGDCPTCSLRPNSTLDYGTDHPLLPSTITDGNGNVTTFTYTAQGQLATRTDAEATGLERTTTWTYDATYPGLVATVARPSVDGTTGGRLVTIERDADGNETSRTVSGVEGGALDPATGLVAGATAFSLETVTEPNVAGEPLWIDPPDDGRYGSTDRTEFTYDSTRGDLVPLTRTDPLLPATEFVHDGFNRRTRVTDPNGVTTVTEYDDLDRVTKITREGADPGSTADDLITVHQYDDYGDLERTILPEGNLIEYLYDQAGRLIEVARWNAGKTVGERVVYDLDRAGNRIREEHQQWDETAGDWAAPDAVTDYFFDTRCRLDRIVRPDGTAEGAVTEFSYDCNGNLEKVWDANHPSLNQTNPPTATYAHDVLDRLTTLTRPWAGAGGGDAVTTFGYDLQDHLISVEDAEGNTTLHTYSDRDLLVREDSPVSGVTAHSYTQHGELEATTDARDVTVTRTLDALDRVTAVDYPDATLDTTYTYDDPLVAFSEGRLTAITRNGHTVAYEYDRFGRTTRDGELTLSYDKNGNRTGIGYPGGASATYGFDFADREIALDVTTGAGSTQVIDTAGYLPSGPLTTLTFGTGAAENRVFDQRYVPESIALDAARDRTWAYTTDPVGNVLEIVSALACPGDLLLSNQEVTETRVEDSCAAIEAGPDYTVANNANGTGDVTFRAATRVVLKDGFAVQSGASFAAITDPSLSGDVTRTYQYQDVDDFLEEAVGPWGTKSWTYDKIGNRLTETDFDGTDGYSYAPSTGGGNTALLEAITLPTLGDREFRYSPAGHQIEMDAGANVVSFSYDDAGRLCEAARSGGATTPFLYDGRSFLRRAGTLSATTGTVEPLYDSSGLLHGLLGQPSTGDPQTRYLIFHLAGRPVAQLALETGQPDRWWYLTTDHLGTPLVATDSSGDELWDNRFEPFGRDMDAGLPWGALESEIFLRFPGQWETAVWQEATVGAAAVYNLHRWYQPMSGRYTKVDPLALNDPVDHVYMYSRGNPLRYLDRLGLAAEICCRLLNHVVAGNWAGQRHCYIVADNGAVYGLYRQEVAGRKLGVPRRHDPRDRGGACHQCPCDSATAQDGCLEQEYQSYPIGVYQTLGPNSNTFVGTLAQACCKGGIPPGVDDAPGLRDHPPQDTGLRPVPDIRP